MSSPVSTATPGPISQQALAKLVRRYAAIAGVPERLAHPHALRGYYATTLASERVPIQEIKARLGHASIETTARYLAELPTPRSASARSSTATTKHSDARATPQRTGAPRTARELLSHQPIGRR